MRTPHPYSGGDALPAGQGQMRPASWRSVFGGAACRRWPRSPPRPPCRPLFARRRSKTSSHDAVLRARAPHHVRLAAAVVAVGGAGPSAARPSLQLPQRVSRPRAAHARSSHPQKCMPPERAADAHASLCLFLKVTPPHRIQLWLTTHALVCSHPWHTCRGRLPPRPHPQTAPEAPSPSRSTSVYICVHLCTSVYICVHLCMPPPPPPPAGSERPSRPRWWCRCCCSWWRRCACRS